jgi:hypothetical protein
VPCRSVRPSGSTRAASSWRDGSAGVANHSPRALGHRDQWSREFTRQTLRVLNISSDAPIVTRDQVGYAKPNPNLFLAAGERLGADVKFGRGWRQRVRSAGGTARKSARRRSSVGWLRAGRT